MNDVDASNDIDASVAFTLNGEPVVARSGNGQRLSTVLRDEFNRTDVKIGCNAGDCGACSVLVDGRLVCACLTGLSQVATLRVETLSGLAEERPLMATLQAAFLQHGAAQCGICTPGMLVSALALLESRITDKPLTEDAVQDALAGVLCRCTGYRAIIAAVLQVDRQRRSTAADGVDQYAGVPTTPGGPGSVGHSVARSVDQPVVPSVGQPVVRLDGQRKVQGDVFGDDVAPADCKVLRVVRSPFHHARFRLGDVAAFIALHPGIKRVLTAADVPGMNRFGVIPPFIDQPVFAVETTRFKGEAIAAVVGDAATMQALDLSAFPVEWQELPALLHPQLAVQNNAEPLHEDSPGNRLCEGFVQRGNVSAALSRAAITVSGQFTTGFVEHAYIEPEAGFARRVGDGIEIHGCTQSAYMDRDAVAAILGLPAAVVRIVPTAVGGGFGSKLDVSFQPFVALASWLMHCPVRMTYSRRESMQSTTKRHPAEIDLTMGVDACGRLCGIDFKGRFNTGAYASWGPTVANRVPVHASGPYKVSDYRAHASGIYTHCAPAGAFRGFGVPQAAIAQESLFDTLALSACMDRLEFRILNALDNGDATVTGQVFDSSVGIKPCLQALRDAWAHANTEADCLNRAAIVSGSPWRRGVGVAAGWYGCGNTSLPNPSTIKAGIRADGSIVLHQGAIDIGQGSHTVITQVFADTLGVALDAVELVGADTAITPDAGKTSASRQTFVSGNAAKLAATALGDDIMRLTNCPSIATLAVIDGELVVSDGSDSTWCLELSSMTEDAEGYVLTAEATYDPPTEALDANGQGKPYAMFGYAAQMVELDVDTELGQVRLGRFVAAHDVGRAINPLLAKGQIHGGIAQGIGMALMEEFIPGRTENLHDYLIPTIGDVPPIESILVEVLDPHGPFGAKGLGEHVLIPTAPAILNAIRDASGACIRELPATPDKVLTAIRRDVPEG